MTQRDKEKYNQFSRRMIRRHGAERAALFGSDQLERLVKEASHCVAASIASASVHRL
jgi:hypothetical protein